MDKQAGVDRVDLVNNSSVNSDSVSNTCIVLVHGIGANRLIMWPLAARLRKAGYRVENWGYPSLFADIRSHAERLADLLLEISREESVKSICLVGHSMGCIVSRAALVAMGDDVPDKIDSAILLTPPNAGSPKADTAAPFLGWLSRPARQLGTSPDSFVNSLPIDLGVPTAVIAAEYDFIVPLSSTHLNSQLEHRVVGGVHSMIVMRKDVVQLIRNFIESHTFENDSESDLPRGAAGK